MLEELGVEQPSVTDLVSEKNTGIEVWSEVFAGRREDFNLQERPPATTEKSGCSQN